MTRKNQPTHYTPGKHWIAIVGAGFAGSSAFIESKNQCQEAGLTDAIGHIIVESSPESEHGRGVAWASNQGTSLLTNMHINRMSFSREERDALAKAFDIDPKKPLTEKEMFKQRSEVGRIFAERFNRHFEEAERIGLETKRIVGTAVNIHEYLMGYVIELSTGEEIFAHTVILALGHMPPTNYAKLRECPGYYGNPWLWGSLKGIPNDARVAVLGLGPTAVDTVITLRDEGVQQIHAFSGSGKMQYPRPRYPEYQPMLLTERHITNIYHKAGRNPRADDFVNLFKNELAVAGADYDDFHRALTNFQRHPPKRYILRGAERVDSESLWFGVLKALDDVTPLMWHLLSSEERRYYLKEYRRQHTNISYGMVSVQAMRMATELNNGSLVTYSGLRGVDWDGDHFKISYSEDGVEHEFEATVVVNCTGVGKDITQAENVLIQNLLRDRWLVPHEDGGAYVDFHSGQLLSETQQPVGDIYCIVGSLTYGTHLLTHCINEVLKSVDRTVTTIHEGIARRKPAKISALRTLMRERAPKLD